MIVHWHNFFIYYVSSVLLSVFAGVDGYQLVDLVAVVKVQIVCPSTLETFDPALETPE